MQLWGCRKIYYNIQQRKNKESKINVEYSGCMSKKWIAIILSMKHVWHVLAANHRKGPTKLLGKETAFTQQNSMHDSKKKCSSTQSRMALVVFIEAFIVCGMVWLSLSTDCGAHLIHCRRIQNGETNTPKKTEPFIDQQ